MINRRNVLASLSAVPVTIALASMAPTAFAQTTAPVYANNGVAVDGSDVVAYFTESRPVQGSAEFSTQWNGAEWRFSSAENLATFQADPEAYAPQYGGYCAWAVSRNYTAATVPEAWTIHEGKLYLNFSTGVQRRWERNIPRNVERGDANWPSVLG